MAEKWKKVDTTQVLLGFSVPKNDPFAARYRKLLELIKKNDRGRFESYWNMKLKDFKTGPELAALSREEQVQLIEAMVRQLIRIDQIAWEFRGDEVNIQFVPGWYDIWGPRSILFVVLREFLRKKLPFTPAHVALMADWVSGAEYVSSYWFPLGSIVKCVENVHAATPLKGDVRNRVEQMLPAIRSGHNQRELRKLAERLEKLLGGAPEIPLRPGEAWSDVALADLKKLKASSSAAWVELLAHCKNASGGKPSKKWLQSAEPLIAAIGEKPYLGQIARWFPLVDKPRTEVIDSWSQWVPNPNLLIIDEHADILKGLVWCCGTFESTELARSLTALTISAYRKVPGIGPRAVKIGNACVYALGEMPGTDAVGQLALLKVRVKFGTAQKGIEKALTAAAQREGVTREELEEMAVPAYGLTEVGRLQEQLGDFTAELVVEGNKTHLRWLKPDGKPQKTIPAAVKQDFADDLKELKQAAKDIEKMLPAQSARIEQAYLQHKMWDYPVWRERYLDHPLVGTIARRLIWNFQTGDATASAIFHDGKFVRADDSQVKSFDKTTKVRLWHPLDESTSDIVAWRDWLMLHEVRQPFKQAHREVYLLTDAERNTQVYSNRFAAHVLKQHQFNALCATRGWKNSLRLMVDASVPPAHLMLPNWNLRAEFWVEGAGDEYGVDTNESGTYLYLATDQVRFYRDEAAMNWAHVTGGGYGSAGPDEFENHPLNLEAIPPLFFSEVMRDVDLFVGVASVGNDPNWHDGGPEGRYREYWANYSFGELGNTAQTRKDILERLIPRLKIAQRCSFADRFLIVRGDVRTYKIHLGSGNILMEPDDEYLCIVPSQSVSSKSDNVFLPFEGDRTLSIILSKAFLLADDKKIKDRTILSQIRR